MVWSICCSIKFHAPGFSDCAEAAEVAEDETISFKCWEYRHTVRPREWFWGVRQLGKTRFLKHRKQHPAAPNEQCPKERLVCWVRNKMTNHIQKPFWKPLQSRHFDVTSNDSYKQYIYICLDLKQLPEPFWNMTYGDNTKSKNVDSPFHLLLGHPYVTPTSIQHPFFF